MLFIELPWRRKVGDAFGSGTAATFLHLRQGDAIVLKANADDFSSFVGLNGCLTKLWVHSAKKATLQ
jgi:hypothetical protein